MTVCVYFALAILILTVCLLLWLHKNIIIVAAQMYTTFTLTWFGPSAVRFCHVYANPFEVSTMFTQGDIKGTC